MGSENKTYARFLTPKISHLIYYNKDIKNGWKNGESFLFEIVVYPPSNSLILKTVISPSDEAYDSLELENILLGVKGAKSSRGDKWLVNHTKKMQFNYDEIHSYDDDTLASLVDKFLDKISPLVSAVEEQLLLNEVTLLELKNTG